MTPIWKQKKIADGPEYFLFSNSHGPSHFLACISSKRTLCTTLFSSKVCKLCFPYVDLFHFWNLRIFVLFCGKVVRTFKQNNSFQNIWMLLFASHIENFFFVLHESIFLRASVLADFAYYIFDFFWLFVAFCIKLTWVLSEFCLVFENKEIWTQTKKWRFDLNGLKMVLFLSFFVLK